MKFKTYILNILLLITLFSIVSYSFSIDSLINFEEDINIELQQELEDIDEVEMYTEIIQNLKFYLSLFFIKINTPYSSITNKGFINIILPPPDFI